MQEKILILDFGSQYTQLIARPRARAERLLRNPSVQPLPSAGRIGQRSDPHRKSLIGTGRPGRLRQTCRRSRDAFRCWAVCYGAQYLSQQFGGEVRPIGHKGIRTRDTIESRCEQPADRRPFGQDASMEVAWRYDREDSGKLNRIIASTDTVPVAAFQIGRRTDLGHPVSTRMCTIRPKAKPTAETFRRGYLRLPPTVDARLVHRIDRPRTARQDQKATRYCWDSPAAFDSFGGAELLHKAVGDQLVCIFVDMGLLRKDEFESVLKSYESMGLNVIGVRAGDNSSPTWPA